MTPGTTTQPLCSDAANGNVRVCACVCMSVCEELTPSCFAYNTRGAVQLSQCDTLGYKFACVDFLSRVPSFQKWHQTSVRCYCGHTNGAGCWH